jgi:hypothetical protein
MYPSINKDADKSQVLSQSDYTLSYKMNSNDFNKRVVYINYSSIRKIHKMKNKMFVFQGRRKQKLKPLT